MTQTIRLNVSTPFLQDVPNSLISKDWYRFLRQIVVILGNGSDVVDLGDFEEEVYTERAPVDYSGSIQSLSDSINLLRAAQSINAQLSARVSLLESQLSIQSKTASSANTLAISDNATYAGSSYPIWAKGKGNQIGYTTEGKFFFNPSTGTLTSTQFSVGGGSAAIVSNGMFGVPGTSLNFAIAGTQYVSFTSGGVYSSAFNNVTVTEPATASTFTLVDGKTFTVDNTITLTATDGATLAIGTGGTLGSAAYTASSAYVPSETPVASGGAATAAGALYSQTQVQSIVTLANNILTALQGNGVMT